MIEVTVQSVHVSLINQHRVVVLREKASERYLPIWIGPFEAEAISMGMQRTEVQRPLTHDLLCGLVAAVGGEVDRIEVTELRDDTFVASIVLKLGGRSVDVDSRPSDAIALAVRSGCPILVSEDVMERAGQIPTGETRGDEAASHGDTDARLQVFREFFDQLDLDLDDDAAKS